MLTRVFLLVLNLIAATSRARAADEEIAPKTSMKEILRARIAEDSKKKNAPGTPAASPKPEKAATTLNAPSTPSATTATPTDSTLPPVSATTNENSPKNNPADITATLLPKVEVKKGRITVLDQQLAQQDEAIAREKKNLKASEVDLALNDSKIARPLAVFGGDSAQFRKRVASERIELMEAEKDLMTAIAQAKSKQEKEDLQKQLQALRTMRRELDKTLR